MISVLVVGAVILCAGIGFAVYKKNSSMPEVVGTQEAETASTTTHDDGGGEPI